MNNNDYILGSHNSWSYLSPKHWWLRPFAFMAKCQSVDIETQYSLGVRCFDLRILYRDGDLCVAHGFMVYAITTEELFRQLQWLNDKGDCYVRVIHEARRKSQYTAWTRTDFQLFCTNVERLYKNIKWWCGRNLYNWEVDYNFGPDPDCDEVYSSVCKPRLIDDWWPWLFAHRKNRETLEKETTSEILLIDFVNIQ